MSKEKSIISQSKINIYSALNIGDEVNHKFFGRGKIVKIQGKKISVHFLNGNITKKLVKKYANLSKIN